ncbi:MAG: HD domain-containing protein [Gammaproteobacteria bacterium]
MDTDARLATLEERARSLISSEDASHDWLHVCRVRNSCLSLGREAGANLITLMPGALLHDVVNIKKDDPRRSRASRLAAEAAAPVLAECGYTVPEVEAIQVIIEEHSYSANLRATTLESAVLQDADRLDALGAIGVFRVATSGSRMGSSYYHPEEPFPLGRELNDRKYSIDHFYRKILELPKGFNTEPGRREAQRRVNFTLQFLEQLRTELA